MINTHIEGTAGQGRPNLCGTKTEPHNMPPVPKRNRWQNSTGTKTEPVENEGAKGKGINQYPKKVRYQNGTTPLIIEPPTYAEFNIDKKDAIVLKQHINFLESGNIPEDLFAGDELCRN